jgi:hypothetical protein
MWRCALLVAAVAAVAPCGARADMSVDPDNTYGLAAVVVTDAERAADRRYGGFPNNAEFNNATRCRKVLALFGGSGAGADSAAMRAFRSYALLKLMAYDIVYPRAEKVPRLIDSIGPAGWQELPAGFAPWCRAHRRDTMDTAAMGVYRTARAESGLP